MSNHLKDSKSRYLSEHSNDKVEWYPWGKIAFEKAKREDKPIFLSIGFYSCKQCRKMTAESFNDAEVSDLMNDTFVCIMLDKDEDREIVMHYVMISLSITDNVDWPITVIMTPGKEIIFIGNYIPKNTVNETIGLTHLIHQIRHIWYENRSAIKDNCKNTDKCSTCR